MCGDILIRVTDLKNEFYIADSMLERVSDGWAIKSKFNNFNINLIVTMKGNLYTGFVKMYKGGDLIIKKFSNLLPSSAEILLKEDEYIEVYNIYQNMSNTKDLRKYAIINSMAILLCYECFQNYILEGCYEITVDQLFNETLICIYEFHSLKQEIYDRTSELLMINYGVEFKKLPFDG